MSCLHGKNDCKKHKARYKCTKCGAVAAKKGKCCKPKKLKGS